MRTLLNILALFFGVQLLQAQIFDVTPIHLSGAQSNRINIVVLGDGYLDSEMSQFITDAESFRDGLFTETPYKEYQDFFNIYAIEVPSNESGTSHPGTATDVTEPAHPVSVVDNYFETTFDYFNIHRLLYTNDASHVYAVLADNFPNYDVVVVIVNTPYYGGSGGGIVFFSTHANAQRIAIHELGHTFGDLRDEYYAGDFYAKESANMTQETDPATVRWKNWHGDNGIGIYRHSGSGNAASWYRPHQSCMMRNLNNSFCSVCTEATVEKIHDQVSFIDAYLPLSSSQTSDRDPFDFDLTLLEPQNSQLDIKWILNGSELNGEKSESLVLDKNLLIDGNNTLQAVVEDQTDFLRVDNHDQVHLSTVSWTINHSTLSIIDTQENRFKVVISPNPAQDIVQISLSDLFNSKFDLTVYDVSGKVIYQSEFNESTIEFSTSEWSSGQYILKFTLDSGEVITQKLLKN